VTFLRINVRIGLILLGGIIALPNWAVAQENDSSPKQISEWKFIELPYMQQRPFQLGLELYLGVGDHANIAQVRPADSIPFPLGTFGGWGQIRVRLYGGPIGLVSLFDGYADGMFGAGYEDEYRSVATSTSFQVLASFPLELAYFRVHIEPYFGFGWLTDWARTKEPENWDVVYRESYHDNGPVWGWEQIVRLGQYYQVRSIFTCGDYKLKDRRLKVEIHFLADEAASFALGKSAKRPKFGVFLCAGLHYGWKGDDRNDVMIYVGTGARGPL